MNNTKYIECYDYFYYKTPIAFYDYLYNRCIFLNMKSECDIYIEEIENNINNRTYTQLNIFIIIYIYYLLLIYKYKKMIIYYIK